MSYIIEHLSLTTGTEVFAWDGPQRLVTPDLAAVADALATVDPGVDAVLCLDGGLPLPDPALAERLLDGPADAWHGGLRLGLEGEPRLFDHVKPQWMLNAPANPSIESTSWRLSLRALLVRTSVLEQLGGPDGEFDTLAGAGFEAGLRWARAGALVRHVPDLVVRPPSTKDLPTTADGIRLIGRHQGRAWAGWALQRSVTTREVRLTESAGLIRTLRSTQATPLPHYQPEREDDGDTSRTVSVIVPTIDRYSYLEPLLHQLAAQTVAPHQVIIADQTPIERRRAVLTAINPDLPVTVIDLPSPGQCTARNAALQQATGEMVLFIDDDDEIQPDLLSSHLQRMVAGVDASCGGVDDAHAGPPPEGFRHRRAADTFPTNNTMLRRSALRRSGLFDLTYDRGSRADHDLGMRLHLAGALLVYDPAVRVFHHHAPGGGLRTHGARTVTRSSSRHSVLTRHLPSPTEMYLGHRYFTERQNREARAISLLTQLSGDGPRWRRVFRLMAQLALLSSSMKQLRATRMQAAEMEASRPPIPQLTEASGATAGD